MFKVFKIIILLIFISLVIFFFRQDKRYLKANFIGYNTSNISVKTSYMVIEIPEISLKRKIFDINDYRNNIDLNVQLLYDNEAIILVSHSGNGDNAYFKNLKKITLNSDVYLYKDDVKIKYKASKIFTLDKKASFGLKKEFDGKLILITCLNREKYLIIECEKS